MRRFISQRLLAVCVVCAASASAQAIEPYQAKTIEPYQAKTIQPYQAKTVQPYQSRTIKPVKARPVQPYRAKTVQAYSGGGTPHVFTQAERAQMLANDRAAGRTADAIKGQTGATSAAQARNNHYANMNALQNQMNQNGTIGYNPFRSQ